MCNFKISSMFLFRLWVYFKTALQKEIVYDAQHSTIYLFTYLLIYLFIYM